MRYKKKPVVIEAFRMGVDPRPDWFQDEVTAGNITTQLADGEIDDGNPWNHKKTCCMIKTLEGVMRGNYDDYIIRGVKGEIYPCKPDIFEATYEAAEGSEIIIPDKLRRPAEVERDELRKQLSEAQAEIERKDKLIEQLKNEITELKWIVNDTSNRLEFALRRSARMGELLRRAWRQLKKLLPGTFLVQDIETLLQECGLSLGESAGG